MADGAVVTGGPRPAVRLERDLPDPPPSAAARGAVGWDACLDRLTGLTPPDDAWRPRFDVYRTAFEPILVPPRVSQWRQTGGQINCQ